MTIEAVTGQKRNKERVNLYSEGAFIGALCAETAIKYGIKDGAVVSDDFFAEIVRADNAKYAFDKALQYLAYARRTEGEVRKHLAAKSLPEDAVGSALEKLIGYGYIDDAQYARQYAAEMMQGKNLGKKALAFKLRQKGISEYDIEDVLAEWSGEEEAVNARSLCDSLWRKYAGDDEPKRRQKVARAMAAKGFDYETIQGVLNRRGE